MNLVASTLMNGARASLARRRAISVLPTPVGPIMMMFFGATSSRSDGSSCCRRHRFRSATATSIRRHLACRGPEEPAAGTVMSPAPAKVTMPERMAARPTPGRP